LSDLRPIDGGQDPEPYVDRREMARRLGVSVKTLDRMVAASEIPSVTWGRRTRRFLPSVVIRALATREQPLHTEEAA
jgi:excisionase family DNA binding protein